MVQVTLQLMIKPKVRQGGERCKVSVSLKGTGIVHKMLECLFC